ncbi:phage tail assembly protein [Cereibacter azotoformans]|uniref:phage tail assembly protein n=1 Tax=Cereibacter azotoformans TaxID=43057 RepID=UPI000C6D6F4B|nr:phage tail assembly protein [Cereibacter azotoformans]
MKTYTLQFPIETEAATVTTLTFRRPRVRDVAVIEGLKDRSQSDATIELIAILTGLSIEVVAEMDHADMITVGEIVTDFLAGLPGPADGDPLPPMSQPSSASDIPN